MALLQAYPCAEKVTFCGYDGHSNPRLTLFLSLYLQTKSVTVENRDYIDPRHRTVQQPPRVHEAATPQPVAAEAA